MFMYDDSSCPVFLKKTKQNRNGQTPSPRIHLTKAKQKVRDHSNQYASCMHIHYGRLVIDRDRKRQVFNVFKIQSGWSLLAILFLLPNTIKV